MPVCIETCEKNISIISTAMIKENHKCNGLQRKGQWPKPSSEAVYTKLARSELNCLKTASSLQHWLFKGAQARGLWVPAAPWGGRDASAELLLQLLSPLDREASAGGNFKSLASHMCELRVNGRNKNQTKNTVQRRETEKEMPFCAAPVPGAYSKPVKSPPHLHHLYSHQCYRGREYGH